MTSVERDIEIALCVFREANDALIVFDPNDLRIVDLNPAALRLTGLEKKKAVGLPMAELLSSADPSVFRQFLDACRRTGFFHSKEGYELARKDAPPIPINLSVSRIHTRPDPLALAMIRDISARKKVEEELRRARDELETRVETRTLELRQAKEVAEAAGRVKDRFLAVLSHELRTPLTPVLAMVSALRDDPTTSNSLRPTLEMIQRSITLEARLIDDLLDLTRFNQRRIELELESVDAHALLEQAAELCRAEVLAAGVKLVVEPMAQARIVQADPDRFLQVVCNLIQNALEFSHPDGTILVKTVDGENGRLIVKVSDAGRGFEPEAILTIFEPFDQVSTSGRNRQGGLGLGLSISRSIIEAHGGGITVTSEGPGRGSTFSFDLPGARPHKTIDPTDSRSIADLPGMKILLVEDNRDVLRYLQIVLEMRGYQVTTAADLSTARELLDRPFDILISDIQLPDGTGLELIRELRGRIPGLAISGFGSSEDIRMSLDAGFARHLTKPIAIGPLEAAIRETLAKFAQKPV